MGRALPKRSYKRIKADADRAAKEDRRQERCNQLYKMDKETLKAIVKRSRQVVDLRSTSKGLLFSMILEDEF